MKSIRSKLLKNFLIVIILTVVILDILALLCLKGYYYKNTQDTLVNQLEGYINFYQKYFSNNKLIDNIYENMDVFWNTNQEQIEILDPNGKLLMDSYGIRDSYLLTTPDIQKAKEGEVGVWTGDVSSYNDKIMVVSKAIKSKLDPNETIGIVRIIFSLKEVHKVIDSFSVLFLFISIIVIVLGIIMSLIIAKDIVSPIKKITDVAREMAKGNLNIRSDVTDNIEIAQLSKTLNYMGCEVEKREKLKNEFISSVSHELRTPLTSIKGWAITLKYDCSDMDTVALGLDIIEKESDRLTEMVEELLDFSKLINGVISLNIKEHDVKSFIEYIENYMRPRAEREGKEFSITIDKNVGKGYFDENRLKQVLSNIIDNAFKFTEENGKISLNTKVEEEYLVFRVKDNGSGISSKDLPRVKDKFYKGKNSKSRNGIGLSICDEIVTLHRGILEIISKENEGTEIIIKIPLNQGET
ncbi:cell wall metabolism sensor histidine kinase WalK [uncultured Clostridium sp.]|uniref:sensor histidine kinase n=1 Tax=uncultured Clostridium sp. TaxID=59620 RepID=UPI0025E7A9ED|nr:HAMP domain-containing sensor histidine kinase [uncultured Clostridium sp.]MDU4883122.1 HAMP domain-containing sensor histidine kinase [Clostridium celatum]MDU7076303.1 HAMP domain-containing sensor histidine kinase [Clostridium celatum]